ncbi:hypothetical protein R5R35_002647 [Gryllus longicercus]|uniref:NADP-dependent oxidoreductase domain-containing protein n=1 Tax=Gryllus longicercus TaxID=2509291 RepID=A0AAN9W186_9ORTH
MLPPTFVPGFHNEEAVRKMRYNELGNTGMLVSHLGFGGGVVNPHLFGDYDRAEVIATVREAVKNGLNYIDTAAFYGQGESEEVIGEALKEIPRQAYYLATKLGRYGPHIENLFDFSAKKSKESFERSLKLLGVEYVDILQAHDIDYAPPGQVVEETLPTMEGFVKEGKVKFIGISAYSLDLHKETIEKSKVKISTVITFTRDTLIDDSLREFIPIFKSLGVGVIEAASPCMALLTNAGPRDWHPAKKEVKELCAKAAQYCKDNGVELARLAINHALSQEGPAVHIVGMPDRKVLNSNLDLLYNGLTAKEKEVLKEINARYLSKVPEKSWGDVEIKEYWANINALKQKK